MAISATHLKGLYWRALLLPRQAFRSMDGWLKPYYCPLQQWSNRGIFAVDIKGRVGLFAQLNWCLYVFAHCERHGLRPFISLSSPFYTCRKSDSWLEYFFENLALTDGDRRDIEAGLVTVSRVEDVDQLGLSRHYESQLTLQYANRLTCKYLQLRQEIEQYVHAFVRNRFGNRKVLGVHFRGTDKQTEAERVAWGKCTRTLHNYLDANGDVDAIFVSSDEAAFVRHLETEFRRVEVISHPDSQRSNDGRATHTRPSVGDNYVKGWEALMNCMLLSRCHALVRTASFLSAWASVFNPALPVVMLNAPYEGKLWFPDREIVERSMNQYLA